MSLMSVMEDTYGPKRLPHYRMRLLRMLRRLAAKNITRADEWNELFEPGERVSVRVSGFPGVDRGEAFGRAEDTEGFGLVNVRIPNGEVRAIFLKDIEVLLDLRGTLFTDLQETQR